MRKIHCGFTLIELVVILGLIGLLMALLVPAVHKSREAARSLQCKSNMRQVSIGLNAFIGSTGKIPGIENWPGKFSLSTQCILLPYLEHSHIYNAINLYAPTDCSTGPETDCESSQESLFQFHSTVAATMIETFLCPSDRNQRPSFFAPISYRASFGYDSIRFKGLSIVERKSDNFFAERKRHPISRISDGLSNTITFSEKPIGIVRGVGYTPFLDSVFADQYPLTSDQWETICRQITGVKDLVRRDSGATWLASGWNFTVFSTASLPNSLVPDCGSMAYYGAFAARSYHDKGVHACMGDGSVHFVKSSINREVWRALGTGSGGEVVDW